MPTIKINQETIKGLRPPTEGRTYYWDSDVAGFGLRISEKGKRTWVAQFRAGGKLVMQTLGTTAELKVSDARARALKSKLAARDGVNPNANKRAAKLALKVEAEKQKQRSLTVAEAA